MIVIHGETIPIVRLAVGSDVRALQPIQLALELRTDRCKPMRLTAKLFEDVFPGA
ncbi:MAG: hypothetical protein JW395_1892 [Nitrospira sp.]|nr:hypothetical protein [Nitrospira sp.]